MDVKTKIEIFVRKSLKCFGSEVALPSNNMFEINEILGDEQNKQTYSIQYGFPQSGSVIARFDFLKESRQLIIDSSTVTVHAVPEGKEMMIANLSQETSVDELGLGMNINFGLDNGTQEYSGIEEIEKSPNAVKMLDIAINDLDEVQILGDCMVAVPMGSKMIPVTTSTMYRKNGTSKII